MSELPWVVKEPTAVQVVSELQATELSTLPLPGLSAEAADRSCGEATQLPIPRTAMARPSPETRTPVVGLTAPDRC